MARLPFNKSSPNRESSRLEAFERFLPSLDLKRRQLIAKRNQAARALESKRGEIEELAATVARELPMLANRRVGVSGLVRVATVSRGRENIVGVALPTVDGVELEIKPYAWLGRPHWVDALVEMLATAVELEIERRNDEERLALLERAVQKVTQRVNLLEKVLIPRTRANIRRINLYLSDQERAGVVRAKLAKSKLLEEPIT